MLTTEIEKPETTTAEPNAKALNAYQAAVFKTEENGGVADTTILLNACRTTKDWERDRQVYRERLQAADTLTNKVPVLEAELVKLQAEAEAAGDIRDARPSEFKTIAELHAGLMKYEAWLASKPDPVSFRPSVKTPEQQAVQNASSSLEQTRGRAVELLSRTAYLDPALLALQSEAGKLQQSIAVRNPVDLAGLITRQRDMVLGLVSSPAMDSRLTPRQQLQAAKAELSRLEKLAATSPGDENQVQQRLDEQRLGEVRERIAALEAKRLEPKCMKWA
jgi:hypothetical protein